MVLTRLARRCSCIAREKISTLLPRCRNIAFPDILHLKHLTIWEMLGKLIMVWKENKYMTINTKKSPQIVERSHKNFSASNFWNLATVFALLTYIGWTSKGNCVSWEFAWKKRKNRIHRNLRWSWTGANMKLETAQCSAYISFAYGYGFRTIWTRLSIFNWFWCILNLY